MIALLIASGTTDALWGLLICLLLIVLFVLYRPAPNDDGFPKPPLGPREYDVVYVDQSASVQYNRDYAGFLYNRALLYVAEGGTIMGFDHKVFPYDPDHSGSGTDPRPVITDAGSRTALIITDGEFGIHPDHIPSNIHTLTVPPALLLKEHTT